MIDLGSDGTQANGNGTAIAGITPEGRFVVFQSGATNLVPGDTNGTFDIFVRDTCIGVTTTGCAPSTSRVSISDDGSEANDGSYVSSISSDGRFVTFSSLATNLTPAPPPKLPNGVNMGYDVFLRDTCVGASASCTPSTILISSAPDGTRGNGDSILSSVSAGGRFVAFESVASNLVDGDTNGEQDVFVRDTCIGAPAGCLPSTLRVSVAGDGTQSAGASFQPAITPDGRFVLLRSVATNLVPADSNGYSDFFIAFN